MYVRRLSKETEELFRSVVPDAPDAPSGAMRESAHPSDNREPGAE
ncbi:hypothetical protein ACF1AJ_16225 [Leifsonia sp. NPDC014704]